jgi:hypothetical protein
MMRKVLKALVVAAGIGLGATSASFAQQSPPQPSLGFYGYGGYTYGWGGQYGYNFIPACPTAYHYTCWVDPYGYKRCGCIVGPGWW